MLEPSERRARILVVEDDAAVARILLRILKKHDVVHELTSAGVLRRIGAGERFDVIVSDVMMPGITGPQLHAELERLAPDQAARMIFVTGGATDDAARAFVESAPRPVLDKPIHADRLRAEVSKLIGG